MASVITTKIDEIPIKDKQVIFDTENKTISIDYNGERLPMGGGSATPSLILNTKNLSTGKITLDPNFSAYKIKQPIDDITIEFDATALEGNNCEFTLIIDQTEYVNPIKFPDGNNLQTWVWADGSSLPAALGEAIHVYSVTGIKAGAGYNYFGRYVGPCVTVVDTTKRLVIFDSNGGVINGSWSGKEYVDILHVSGNIESSEYDVTGSTVAIQKGASLGVLTFTVSDDVWTPDNNYLILANSGETAASIIDVSRTGSGDDGGTIKVEVTDNTHASEISYTNNSSAVGYTDELIVVDSSVGFINVYSYPLALELSGSSIDYIDYRTDVGFGNPSITINDCVVDYFKHSAECGSFSGFTVSNSYMGMLDLSEADNEEYIARFHPIYFSGSTIAAISINMEYEPQPINCTDCTIGSMTWLGNGTLYNQGDVDSLDVGVFTGCTFTDNLYLAGTETGNLTFNNCSLLSGSTITWGGNLHINNTDVDHIVTGLVYEDAPAGMYSYSDMTDSNISYLKLGYADEHDLPHVTISGCTIGVLDGSSVTEMSSDKASLTINNSTAAITTTLKRVIDAGMIDFSVDGSSIITYLED